MTITIDGTSGIASVDGSSGSPSVRGSDSNSGIVYAADTVSISTGGTERLEVDSSGNIDIPDNGKIRFGGSADLSIYHTGSNARIDNGTGDLYINAASGETGVGVYANAQVELYYNNAKVFETLEYGARIKRPSGGSTDLEIVGCEGQNAYIHMYADEGDDNADKWRICSETGNNAFWIQNYADGDWEGSIECRGGAETKISFNNVAVLQTIVQGIKLHNGTSTQIHMYDVNTATIRMYTNAYDLRWYDDVNDDNIMQLSQNGDLNIDGNYSNNGVDYAEYFESTDGKVIAVGTTVVLENGKVRAATDSETPIGVIRPKTSGTSVTGGVNQFKWQGKYLVDDYDGQLVESAVHCTWTDSDRVHQQCWKDRPPTGVTIPEDAEETTMERPKLNPDFDESKTYVPRSERDEWNCVGLLGQIPITKGQPTSSNWIKMKDKTSTVELWLVK